MTDETRLELPPLGLDPKAVLLLAVGVDPSREPTPKAVRRFIIGELATALEVPPLTAEQHLDRFESTLAEFEPPDTSDSIEAMDTASTMFVEWLKSLMPAFASHRGDGIGMGLAEILQRRLRVNDIGDLALVLSSTLSRSQASDMLKLCPELLLTRAKGLVQAMINVDQAAALRSWYESASLLVPSLPVMSPFVEPMIEYQEAASEYRDGPARSIRRILRAWHDAYEGPVLRVLLHVEEFGRARGLVSEPLQRDKSGQIRRGKVFPNVRMVCQAIGAPFPVHPRLAEIRNAIAHKGGGTHAVIRGKVHFSGPHGDFELTFEEVKRWAFDDIHLPVALDKLYSLIPLHGMQRRVAAAWARLREQIPELQNPEPYINRRAEPKQAIVMSRKHRMLDAHEDGEGDRSRVTD